MRGESWAGRRFAAFESRFRRADYAHMLGAASRLLECTRQLWNDRIDTHHEQAAYLKSQLRGHEFVLQQLLEHAPTMASTLLPIWTASPFALARHVPPTMRFDAAILLDFRIDAAGGKPARHYPR